MTIVKTGATTMTAINWIEIVWTPNSWSGSSDESSDDNDGEDGSDNDDDSEFGSDVGAF